MFITSHAAAGAAIGASVNHPIPAFLAGYASHFAMDAVPHWGGMEVDDPEFMTIAKTDGLVGLFACAVLLAAAGDRRLPVAAGIAGACLPDMDKPALLLLGVVPFPRTVNEFHARIQREDLGRLKKEAAVGAVIVAASVGLVAFLGRR